MKYTVLRHRYIVFAALMLMGGAEPLFAHVIYGLDKAADFKATRHGPFTVQAGSFRSEQNARQFRNKLAATTKYPVRVHSSRHLFVVTVGPLPTAEAVRKVGHKEMRSAVKHRSAHHPKHVNIQKHPQPPHHHIEKHVPPKKYTETSVTTPVKHASIFPALLSNGSWYVAGDAGLFWPDTNDHMTVSNGSSYAAPQNLDTYSTNYVHNQPTLAASLGYRWQREQQFIPAYSLALRYQHMFTEHINGNIYQYSLPEFKNYAYTWNVSANVISLYSKIDLVRYWRLMPYVDGGIGASFNQTNGFTESAFAGITPRISPNYSSNTQGQFAYNVGAGIDFMVTPQAIVSVGYDFQSLGRLASGPGQSTWSSTRLSLGNFTANTALISLTYVMDGPSQGYSK